MHTFAEINGVSIKAEGLFDFGYLTLTNSEILSVLGFVVTVVWLCYVGRKVRRAKPDDKFGFFTRLAIWCFSALYKTCKEIIPNPKICKIIAPFAITLFFYIGIQYYVGLLPIAGDALTWNGTPLLRGAVADLSFTFALAILVIVLVQIVAIVKHGFSGNARRYFRNPFKNPLGFFEGLLELISEFSRLLSLSIRLFGNVLAGEILIIIVSQLAGRASPIMMPVVYIFEMFVGGIQAYVFFSLTVVFAGIATEDLEQDDNNKKVGASKTLHKKIS